MMLVAVMLRLPGRNGQLDDPELSIMRRTWPAAVRFESPPRIPSCCSEFSEVCHVCVYPGLKIDEEKCSIYSLFEEHLLKATVPSCLRKLFNVLKINWRLRSTRSAVKWY